MAKAIRWQVPFTSLGGTHYRVDIYDEGYTGSPVQLLPGDQPFVTSEDNSEDYFAPIRTQTGTLQVCTALPNGGRISLDELLPANNIARPVRLINLDNSNAIEWQGFLSCEAYSQNYTAIPENLSLSLIGVLEAMDSVELALDESKAYMRIFAHALYAMKIIEDKTGMELFSNVYISEYLRQSIQNFRLYNYPFYSSDEIVNGDNVVVETHSISCKKVLEEIANFYGATWRESKRSLYLQVVGKDSVFKYNSFANYYNIFVNGSSISNSSTDVVSSDISLFDWRGVNHKCNKRQGAKRVKISARLQGFDCKIGLRECPYGNLHTNPDTRWSSYGEIHANSNSTFYSLATHRHLSSLITIFPMGSGNGPRLEVLQAQTAVGYDSTIFWVNNDFRTNYKTYIVNHTNTDTVTIPYMLTSYMALWRDEDNELQSGLMICGAPEVLYNNPDDGGSSITWTTPTLSASNALYTQSSALILSAYNGYFRLDFEVAFWRNVFKNHNMFANINAKGYITVALQFGSSWLQQSGTTYSWSNSFNTIKIPFNHEGKIVGNWSANMGIDEEDGIFVNIPQQMNGFVKLYIYHQIDAELGDMHTFGPACDVFITRANVEYVPLKYELYTHRSSNDYYTDTGQPFRDEVSKSLSIASNARNSERATLIYDSSDKATNATPLGGAVIRPERDLMNRMVDYYSAARQTLDLIVNHPTVAPLPLLKLNGINDGKVYLPLSESRDWQTGVCKLTCFETPT